MMQMLSYRPSARVSRRHRKAAKLRRGPAHVAADDRAEHRCRLLGFTAADAFVSGRAWFPSRFCRWCAAAAPCGFRAACCCFMSALLFGCCLTVAVVHSLDGERYSFNLLVYAVLCEAASAVWLFELVCAAAWIGRGPAPPSSPAPAATIPFTSVPTMIAIRPPCRSLSCCFAGANLGRAQEPNPVPTVAPVAPWEPLAAPRLVHPTATPAAADPAATPAPKPDATIENSVVKVFSTVRYPDPLPPLEQAGSQGLHRQRRGHRRPPHPHQRPRRPLRQPDPDPGQPGRRQAQRHRRIRRARHRPRRAQGRRRKLLRHPRAAAASPRPCPTSRTPSWSTVTRKGVRVCRSPRASFHASSSRPTTLRCRGLRIQIDAAINPGNSGGPAIVGDHMIGLAFSRLTGDAQNIGYIIPGEEIELFLADIADGKYDGKPSHVRPLPDARKPGAARLPQAR